MAKKQAVGSTEKKFLAFAEDLGRVLGSAEARANAWMDQRKTVVKVLAGVRAKADDLIRSLGGESPMPWRKSKNAAAKTTKRAKRKLSAAGRKAISDAQKARWAKTKAAKRT